MFSTGFRLICRLLQPFRCLRLSLQFFHTAALMCCVTVLLLTGFSVYLPLRGMMMSQRWAPLIKLLLVCLWFGVSHNQQIDETASRQPPSGHITVLFDFMFMHSLVKSLTRVCGFFFCAGKMARPLHWGLLLLCIACFCSQLVATGNQSSRGQTGRSQTQPDQSQSLRDSLWFLATSLVPCCSIQVTKTFFW